MAIGYAEKIAGRYARVIDDGVDRWLQAVLAANNGTYTANKFVSDVIAHSAEVGAAWSFTLDSLFPAVEPERALRDQEDRQQSSARIRRNSLYVTWAAGSLKHRIARTQTNSGGQRERGGGGIGRPALRHAQWTTGDCSAIGRRTLHRQGPDRRRQSRENR